MREACISAEPIDDYVPELESEIFELGMMNRIEDLPKILNACYI